MAGRLYRMTAGGIAAHDGVVYPFHDGTIVREGHPLLRAGVNFAEVTPDYEWGEPEKQHVEDVKAAAAEQRKPRTTTKAKAAAQTSEPPAQEDAPGDDKAGTAPKQAAPKLEGGKPNDN